MGELFNDIVGALIDGLDSLAFGIPSSVLLRNISEDYKVEFSKVQEIYAQLNTLINAMGIERDKVAERKADLMAESHNYAPLSGLKHSLVQEYKRLGSQESELSERIAKLTDEATAASNRLGELSNNMGNSLGTEAKRRLLE